MEDGTRLATCSDVVAHFDHDSWRGSEKGTEWWEIRADTLKEIWDNKYGESIFPCKNLAKKIRFVVCLRFASVSSLSYCRTWRVYCIAMIESQSSSKIYFFRTLLSIIELQAVQGPQTTELCQQTCSTCKWGLSLGSKKKPKSLTNLFSGTKVDPLTMQLNLIVELLRLKIMERNLEVLNCKPNLVAQENKLFKSFWSIKQSFNQFTWWNNFISFANA